MIKATETGNAPQVIEIYIQIRQPRNGGQGPKKLCPDVAVSTELEVLQISQRALGDPGIDLLFFFFFFFIISFKQTGHSNIRFKFLTRLI